MASMTNQENLEERMERIRKTNEQIEKKHREAEEDRILALKANAMISTKAPDESSWPKTHAYDEVDFKYEKEDSDEANERNEKRVLPLSVKTRDYKIFADIPADPTYRFLYEPERDGPSNANNNSNANINKNANPNQFHNNKNNSSFDRRNERKSFGSHSRGGGGSGGGGHLSGNNRSRDGGGYNEKGGSIRDNMQRSRTHHDFDTDSRPFNSKNNGPKPNNGSSQNHAGRGSGDQERRNNFQNSPKRSSTPPPLRSGKSYEEGVEKITKGNITVSVSKDGEVKSVKLSSTPSFGSGRVGNFGQQNAKTHFPFNDQQQRDQGNQNPRSPPSNTNYHANNPRYQQNQQQNFNRNANNNFDRNQPNRKSDKRNNNFNNQSNNSGNNKPRSSGNRQGSNNLDCIANLVPSTTKTNLQERLQRNRSVTIDTQDNIKISVTPTATATTESDAA